MRLALPDSINNLTIVVFDETAIDVSWEAPSFARLCVKNYTIELKSEYENRTQYTPREVLVFTNIFPCVDYKVIVTPSTNIEDLYGTPLEKE